MLYQFVQAQLANPVRGDWCTEIKVYTSEMNLTFDDIKLMKKKRFSQLAYTYIYSSAFEFLIKRQSSLSKGKEINYGNCLSIQNYLLPHHNFNLQEKRDLFAYRCRMNNIQANFPAGKPIDLCECGEALNNPHILICKIYSDNVYLEYNNIYNGSLEEQISIMKKMKKNITQRCSSAVHPRYSFV